MAPNVWLRQEESVVKLWGSLECLDEWISSLVANPELRAVIIKYLDSRCLGTPINTPFVPPYLVDTIEKQIHWFGNYSLRLVASGLGSGHVFSKHTIQ
jgi:hypothetical protein